MSNQFPQEEVIVVGSGNAALIAALSASEAGAKVTIYEASNLEAMGGNSRFTFGGFRFGLSSVDDIKCLIPNISKSELDLIYNLSYTPDNFFDHLMDTSQGKADKELCKLLADNSYNILRWMKDLGVEWSLCISQVPSEPLWKLSPGSVFVNGRGKGLINNLIELVNKRQIKVFYGASLEKILLDDDGCIAGIKLKKDKHFEDVKCLSVILACGGFEANKSMRKKYLGDSWSKMKVRGTRHNTGKGLKAALSIGAQRYGNWAGGHAVPVDKNAANFGVLALGETTRRCLFQYGISVNNDGKRFMDEGENKKTLMYGKTGVEVAKLKEGCAFQVFDAKIMSSNFEKLFYFSGKYLVANTLEELAHMMGMTGIKKNFFIQEVKIYNSSINVDRPFDTSILDARCTTGIFPPRSNYAVSIDMPPYFAFPVSGGVTFTYGGIKINPKAEVVDDSDEPIPGLYAAGEMTGGFFMDNYPANAGLSRGAVTGYFAGKSAANYIYSIKNT